MGAGNWGLRSAHLDTETWHVDAVPVSFDDYRESALQELRDAVKAANPGISDEALKHVSLDELQDFGWEIEGLDEIKEGIEEEFEFLDSREGYYQSIGDDRCTELVEGLQGAVANVVGDKRDYSALRKAMKYEKCDADKNAFVMGVGKLTQVVLRSWENYYYIGIGPTNELDQLDYLFKSENADAYVETLLTRCMAALDPENPKLAAHRTPLAPIELRPHESVTPGEKNLELLEAVVRRAVVLAERLESELEDMDGWVVDPADASAAAAARAALEERISQFEAGFGVAPAEFSVLSDSIDEYLAFVEQIGMTPGMAEVAYGEELSRMTDAVLNFMAVNEEDVYRPDSAWTSRKTDLSPYRYAAAVQLDAQAAALIKSGQDSALIQVLTQDPSRVSLMKESDFDACLAGAVQAACPIVTKLKTEMFTLHEEAPATANQSAVLVWRGHLDWGHFDLKKFEAASQKLVNDGAGISLDDLPQWMTHLTLEEHLRGTLGAVDIPPEVAKSFYAADGSLEVTGVLAEAGVGQMRALYVTTSARPFEPTAHYEPVVLNGLVREVPAPTPEMEVSHG